MEQQPGRVFIIKATPGSLTGAENYLKNRSWQIASGSSLKDCIQFLMKNRPDFVLITADHKNRKITVLPKILRQAFGIYVVGYSEIQSANSYKTLEDMDVDYRIYQTPSGPTIERTLINLQREVEERKKNPSSKAEDFQKVEQQKAAAQTAFAQLMGHGDGGQGGAQGRGSTFLKIDGGKQDSFSMTQEAAKGQEFAFRQNTQTGSGVAGGFQHPASGIHSNGYQEGLGGKGSPSSGSSPAPDQSLAEKSVFSDWSQIEDSQKSTWVPASEKGFAYQTVISKAIDHSVDKTVIHSPLAQKAGVEKILRSSKVACLLVDCPQFTGYVVAALGQDRQIDDEFMITVRGHLVQYLRDQGVDLDRIDLMNLKVNQVEFNNWALEKAEFLKTTLHEDKEIAVAFFALDRKRLVGQFEESKNISKLQFALADIEPNTPLEFDLYLYLAANDKYLLYTPENFPVYENQLQRLKERGVVHVHVRKEQSSKVHKYHAQNFLNQKIKDFENSLLDSRSAS